MRETGRELSPGPAAEGPGLCAGHRRVVPCGGGSIAAPAWVTHSHARWPAAFASARGRAARSPACPLQCCEGHSSSSSIAGAVAGPSSLYGQFLSVTPRANVPVTGLESATAVTISPPRGSG
ncbi:unnamed protein product [Caretta caretta]